MMKRILTPLLALLTFAYSASADAQNTVDIGVIKNDDVKVVQQLLYPKEGRTEIGGHLATMPFDAYTFTILVRIHGVKELNALPLIIFTF